jgi:hypothetical protein
MKTPNLAAKAGVVTAEPILIVMEDVKTLPVSWLWRYRIPRGAVTLLDGDPSLGKSTLVTDLAARVSRGWEMPPLGGPCAVPNQKACSFFQPKTT